MNLNLADSSTVTVPAVESIPFAPVSVARLPETEAVDQIAVLRTDLCQYQFLLATHHTPCPFCYAHVLWGIKLCHSHAPQQVTQVTEAKKLGIIPSRAPYSQEVTLRCQGKTCYNKYDGSDAPSCKYRVRWDRDGWNLCAVHAGKCDYICEGEKPCFLTGVSRLYPRGQLLCTLHYNYMMTHNRCAMTTTRHVRCKRYGPVDLTVGWDKQPKFFCPTHLLSNPALNAQEAGEDEEEDEEEEEKEDEEEKKD